MAHYNPNHFTDLANLENSLRACQNALGALDSEAQGLSNHNASLRATKAAALAPATAADRERDRIRQTMVEALRAGMEPHAGAMEAASIAAQMEVAAMPGRIEADAADVVIGENNARILEINGNERRAAREAVKVAEADLAIGQLIACRDNLISAVNPFVDAFIAMRLAARKANHLLGVARRPPIFTDEPVQETLVGGFVNCDGLNFYAGTLRAAIDAGLMHAVQAPYAHPRPVPLFKPEAGENAE